MYSDVWIAQKITQNAENHIFEVLDFQIFLKRIAPPPPGNVYDLSDMHRSEKSLDPRLLYSNEYHRFQTFKNQLQSKFQSLEDQLTGFIKKATKNIEEAKNKPR